MLLDGLFKLGGHDIQRLAPRDLDKLVALAKQRHLIAVGTIKNLGEAIAFDAKKATIDGSLRIAPDSHHLTFPKTYQHAASDATETTGALFPGLCRRLGSLRLTHRAREYCARRGDDCSACSRQGL
jgi:hypothetical protein